MPTVHKISNGDAIVTITELTPQEVEASVGLTREVKATLESICRFLFDDAGIVATPVPQAIRLKVFLPESLSIVQMQAAQDLVREVCWHHNASSVSYVKRDEVSGGENLFYSLEFAFTTELGSRFATRMGVTEEGCEALNAAMEQTAQRVADRMAIADSGIEIISN